MKSRIAKNSSFKIWTAAAVTAAFFVPLGILGAPALAKSAASASQYEYSGSSQYQYHGKITLCHRTHSRKHGSHQITVGAAAARAHLRHGDTLGSCPPPTASPHGRSGDHGKGHDGSGSGKQGDDDQTEHGGTAPSDSAQAGKDHGNSGDHGQSGDHGKGHGK